MSLLSGLRARLRALTRDSAADRDLADEIRFHLDLETDKNIRLGMTPDEARRVAVAHFGGVQRVREEHRDVRRLPWIDDAIGDARFALRAMRRSPALLSAAVLTIALGIGSNVAVFSALDAVVLRPLPFPHPDRLMVITEENSEKHWHLQDAAAANLFDWRAGVGDFADAAGYLDGAAQTALLGGSEPTPLQLALVTGSFFSTLDVRPALGTAFTFEQSMREDPVVVLSDAAWRRVFRADSSIIGKSVRFGTAGRGQLTRIVGVMPREFSYPRDGIDVWQCLTWSEEQRASINYRRAHWLRAIARLKPGATPAHANAELQAVVNRLKHDYPNTNAQMSALMMPLQRYLTRDTRLPLLLLFVAAAFLLLIACANVGNLLLVRAAGRDREMALRLALGADRSRVVRQAFTESLVLSALGGALGLMLGWVGTRVFVHLEPEGLLNVQDFGVDSTVVAFVVGVSLVSGFVFGVAPALWTRRRDAAESLKSGGRSALTTPASARWRDALIASEVALALLMLVGGALLAKSFWRLRHVDPGFDPHGVLAMETGVRQDSAARIVDLMRDLRRRARALPGVTDAALSVALPTAGPAHTSDYTAFGRGDDQYGTEIAHLFVSPEYFHAMRLHLVRGRTLGDDDRLDAPRVTVINETLARSYFTGQDPIGQRLAFDRVATAQTRWYTIVGIVADEHFKPLDVPVGPAAYVSLDQEPSNRVQLLLRTSGDPLSLVAPARRVMREIDPTNALVIINTMDDVMSRGQARIRFLTTLMLSFAFIGLLLSIVGVYGVLAQSSRNRTREVGVRIALGASGSAVRWLVVRDGLRMTVAGLVVGVALARIATPLMGSLLFGVAPTDVQTLIAVALVIAATSVAAAWIPARRASLVDPVVALRGD